MEVSRYVNNLGGPVTAFHYDDDDEHDCADDHVMTVKDLIHYLLDFDMNAPVSLADTPKGNRVGRIAQHGFDGGVVIEASFQDDIEHNFKDPYCDKCTPQ